MKKLSFVLLCIISLALVFSSCKSSNTDNYKKGTLTKTTFESEYLDLKFNLPQGYTMATEEEVLKLANQGAELAGIDSKKYDYAMANTVYEMQVVASTGFPNTIVMVEKLSLSNMTIDTYLDTLKKQLTEIPNLKYTVASKKEKETLVGKEYIKMTATASYGTLSLIQDYYVRIQDGRAISFIVSYSSDTKEQKDSLLSAFTTFK